MTDRAGLVRLLIECRAYVAARNHQLMMLESDNATETSDLARIDAAITALSTELVEAGRGEDIRDAARYRWLRDKCDEQTSPNDCWTLESPADLWGAAIDNAIAQQAAGGKGKEKV